MIDQAHFRQDLAGEERVRERGLEALLTGTQDIGDHEGIAGIGTGVAQAVALPAVLDHSWGQNIDLGVVSIPEEIDQEIVRSLQPH
jgi:hypothetical protein